MQPRVPVSPAGVADPEFVPVKIGVDGGVKMVENWRFQIPSSGDSWFASATVSCALSSLCTKEWLFGRVRSVVILLRYEHMDL